MSNICSFFNIQLPNNKKTINHIDWPSIIKIIYNTNLAKSLKQLLSLSSRLSILLKKQLSISFTLRFFTIHGVHPLSCFDGCKRHFIL